MHQYLIFVQIFIDCFSWCYFAVLWLLLKFTRGIILHSAWKDITADILATWIVTKIWGGVCGIKGGGGEERQHRRVRKLLFPFQWLNPNHCKCPFSGEGSSFVIQVQMGSIREATPQALPVLRVTFKTSSVFSSWWWDLLFYFYFFFSFCVNRKIKITWMLSLSKSSPSCFIPPGALGNRLRLFASLNGAVILFYGSCGKAIRVKLSSTHPPTCELPPAWTSCWFGKNEGTGVCAMRF